MTEPKATTTDFATLSEAVLRRLAGGVVNVRTAAGDSVTYADPAAQLNALRELEKRARVGTGGRGLSANSTRAVMPRDMPGREHAEALFPGRG